MNLAEFNELDETKALLPVQAMRGNVRYAANWTMFSITQIMFRDRTYMAAYAKKPGRLKNVRR